MDNGPFNVQPYNDHLSSFEKSYNGFRTSQQKCVHTELNCSSGNLNKHNEHEHSEPINNYSRKKCHLKFLSKEIPIHSNSTPLDLLNLNRPENNEQKVLSRDDLVIPAIKINRDLSKSLRNEYNVNDENVRTTTMHIGTSINIVSDSPCATNEDITWNNMFDSEFFEDDTTVFNTELLNDVVEIKLNPNPEESSRYSFKKPNSPTTMKRKSSTKNDDQRCKKENKTVAMSKKLYRKDKYTKTVKNWLNNVEETLAVDCTPNNYDIIDKNNTENDNVKKRSKNLNQSQFKIESLHIKRGSDSYGFEINPSTEITKKKVVQAQLANRDGKMKFKRPLTSEEDLKNEPFSGSENAEKTTLKSTKSVKDKVNDKNKKAKFFAPIKSQIPVQNIVYNIKRLDGSNTEVVGKYLKTLVKTDVLIVLIYSYGFCQLNGCYTEATCAPEGLLVLTTAAGDNDFYYFANFDERVCEILSQLLEQNTILCYEGKSILMFLTSYGIKTRPFSIMDAKIGGALLEPENPPETFSDLQKLVGFAPEFTIATDCSLQKAAWYSVLLKDCMAKLRTSLVDNSLWDVFVNLEMPLVPIIADMESRGVAVDLEKLQSMEQLLLGQMKAVEQQCYQAAGRTFQINSPAQVRALLFDELKLDAKCNVKIRETLVQGAKSTSEATLRSLMSEHALPKLILEYRHLHKAHATFLTGIAHHVKNGVVRPTWVQTAAVTGRIASNNPNLQAIPKAPFSLVMFPESDDVDNPSLNFRSVYVAREGHSLLAADFRHVECRVFAHAAGDAVLQAALQADDLFRVLAAKWLNKSESEVSASDRSRTKRVVYASLYGCGPRTLADVLAVPYDQALAFLASFNKTFPSLKSFGRRVVSRCRREGRLATLRGRARAFKDISSQDFAAKSHAERQAINFVVQGSAADLCKTAMLATEQRLRTRTPGLRARLLLQIHDELVWEVRDEDMHEAAVVIKEAMESCGAACGVQLRLPVACARGRDWAGCRTNIPGTDCRANTTETDCHVNTTGTDCRVNTTGTECHANTTGSDYRANTTGTDCRANTTGTDCHVNTTGTDCRVNTTGTDCHVNTTRTDCRANTTGTDCHVNTTGTDCRVNTTGTESHANTTGSDCPDSC